MIKLVAVASITTTKKVGGRKNKKKKKRKEKIGCIYLMNAYVVLIVKTTKIIKIERSVD